MDRSTKPTQEDKRGSDKSRNPIHCDFRSAFWFELRWKERKAKWLYILFRICWEPIIITGISESENVP